MIIAAAFLIGGYIGSRFALNIPEANASKGVCNCVSRYCIKDVF